MMTRVMLESDTEAGAKIFREWEGERQGYVSGEKLIPSAPTYRSFVN